MPPIGKNGAKLYRPAYCGKLTVALIVGISLLLSGCGRKSGPVAQEQTNLGWLGSMYGMFVGQHRGRTPKNIDEFRKFVELRIKPDQLARLKVAKADDLFVSPRDGKPFQMVAYSKLTPPAIGQPPPIVFYEQVGENGQRAVAFLGGGTRQVDEATLQNLLPASTKLSP